MKLLDDDGTGDFQISVDGLDRMHVIKYAATFTLIRADLPEPQPGDDQIVWFSGTNPVGSFWTSQRWLCKASKQSAVKPLVPTSLKATVAFYLRY